MDPVPASEHRWAFTPAAGLGGLSDQSIQLVVTSPPYPMIEMWDQIFAAQDKAIAAALLSDRPEAAFEAMHRLLDSTWRDLARVVCQGGIVCVNIGDAARSVGEHFRLFSNHARIIQGFLNLGFHNLPNIIWRKPTNAPNKFMGSGMLPPGAYVTLEHEYILIFRKGPAREFKTVAEKKRRAESAFFWEERNRWFSDVWFDLTGTGQNLAVGPGRSRSGAFPLELAWRLINMYSVKGDTVLDPFLGTGTTTLAAVISERNSVGFEIDAHLRHAITRQVDSAPAASERVVTERLESHREFVTRREAEKKPLHYTIAAHGLPCISRQETGILLRQVERVEWDADATCRAIYRDIVS